MLAAHATHGVAVGRQLQPPSSAAGAAHDLLSMPSSSFNPPAMSSDGWIVSNFASVPKLARQKSMTDRSPRYSSPRDIIRDAARTLEHSQPIHLPQRKGRPPPSNVVPTTLSAETRAMLARTNGDQPPRQEGFGAKVSADLSEISTIFYGTTIPKRLEVSAIEKEQRRVAAMVNASEEESNACLLGLLGETSKAMDKAEAEMQLEKARQEKLAKEMKERQKESHRPGRRTGRARRRNKTASDGTGEQEGNANGDLDEGSGYGSDEGSYTSSTAEVGEEDAGEGGGAVGRRRHLMMVPSVVQGFPDLHARHIWRSDEEERKEKGGGEEEGEEEEEVVDDEEYLYDEDGEVLCDEYGEPLRAEKSLGPTSDRMHRILDAHGETGWSTVPQAEIIKMMKRIRFFREAELQEDVYSSVAEWVEVQTWDPFMQIAQEGTWCHSFVILYSGTIEAQGRVYRAPGTTSNATQKGGKGGGGKGGSASQGGGSQGKRNDNGGVAASQEPPGPPDPTRAARETSLLPVPQLVGPYETLAPVLLYPGASFGEASLAGARYPHTCSVRTLTRCTLLVLRRSKVQIEVPLLPATARQGWEYESNQMQRMYTSFAARWRHHNLRRLRLCKGLALKLLHQVEKIGEYKILPGGTTVHRVGEGVTHLMLLLAGQVGIYKPDDEADDTDYDADGMPLPPALLRKVSDKSNVPLIGDAPLMMPTASEARGKPPSETHVLTHTEVQMISIPYDELAQRPNLLAELRKRVQEMQEQPSTLMALLMPPAISSRAAKGASPKAPAHSRTSHGGSAAHAEVPAAPTAAATAGASAAAGREAGAAPEKQAAVEPTPKASKTPAQPSAGEPRPPPTMADFAYRRAGVKIRVATSLATRPPPALPPIPDTAEGEPIVGDTTDALPVLA